MYRLQEGIRGDLLPERRWSKPRPAQQPRPHRTRRNIGPGPTLSGGVANSGSGHRKAMSQGGYVFGHDMSHLRCNFPVKSSAGTFNEFMAHLPRSLDQVRPIAQAKGIGPGVPPFSRMVAALAHFVGFVDSRGFGSGPQRYGLPPPGDRLRRVSRRHRSARRRAQHY